MRLEWAPCCCSCGRVAKYLQHPSGKVAGAYCQLQHLPPFMLQVLPFRSVSALQLDIEVSLDILPPSVSSLSITLPLYSAVQSAGLKTDSCEDSVCSPLHQKPKSEAVQRDGKTQVWVAMFPEGKFHQEGLHKPMCWWQSSSPFRPHHIHLQSHRILSWAGDELGANTNDLQR